MTSKKVFLVSVIFAIFICAVGIFAAQTYHIYQKPVNRVTPEVLYIVKEHGGRIAVFLPDTTTPSQILPDPYVRDLPPADRNMLEAGVAIYSPEQLQNLIQDLCS